MSIERDARAEAEKRWPSLEPEKDAYTGYPPSALRYYEQGAFVAGAEWQASRPVTDEQVEVAARAFGGVRTIAWDVAEDWEKEHVREFMRIALEAAREVGA